MRYQGCSVPCDCDAIHGSVSRDDVTTPVKEERVLMEENLSVTSAIDFDGSLAG